MGAYIGPIVEDHTVGLVSRPISGPVELLWRVKTISAETAERVGFQYVRFPRLEAKPIPSLATDRSMMSHDRLRKWLKWKGRPCVQGRLSLLLDGDEYFQRLEDVLADARSSIRIQTFIFDNDDVALEVAELLKRKSRDLSVRILADGIGSRRAWEIRAPSADAVPQPGIANMFDYLQQDSAIELKRGRNLWLSTDHSKVILVDDRLAFFGGMNIGREYRYDWRDMMVEVEGPLVREFKRQFEWSWNRTRLFADFFLVVDRLRRHTISKGAEGGEYWILLTTPFRRQIFDAQLKAIRLARHHVYVENPYLWNQNMLYRLCEARKRGVDVRVTIPLHVNIPIGGGANRVALNTLLRHGVRVFLYPGMTHVKAAVFDGWACFGTANFDDLSLHKNVEMDLMTDEAGFAGSLEAELLLDGQDSSYEIKTPLSLEMWDELCKSLANFL
ncbi:MAG: phosphatidylserine/phosphatidylglycerophosphate/cardiolipin synthase family protein [Lentisphaerae bacterium]|nr:phosphatidylserine/phosphatidylglycerophosphate/cardiolipin synthase family protein [Lentisphaerota bacterium]